MTRSEISKLVGNTIFSAVFVKKNGDKRKMLCRLGVKRYLKGGVKTCDKVELLTVFDLVKREYRTININTLEKLNYRGINLIF